MRDEYEHSADQTQYLPMLPEEPSGAARAAGLKRLSRLTWRVTELGAITAVGFATVFARTAPAQTLSSHAAPTPSATSATPAPANTAARPHRKRHARSTATQPGQTARQPNTRPGQPGQPGSKPAAAPTKSAAAAKPGPTLAPPTTAPAAAPPPPPSSAPAPQPTVSSASTGHG
jgi:hypothetical protein